MRPLTPLLILLLAAPSAYAKSNSWWDCYYREFELCQGRARDPDAPAEVGGNAKAYCEGAARKSCDDEESAKVFKLEGHSANERKAGSLGAAPANTSPTPATVSEVAAKDAEAALEGRSPSGDETVLGVTVTAPIGEVADRLVSRNLRGCSAIDSAFARRLCLDAPGAKGGNPVTLEYYRGHLELLSYDRGGSSDSLNGAITEAERRTGAHAALSEENGLCAARFAVGGGTLTYTGTTVTGEACAAASLDIAALARVEWVPSVASRASLEAQRAADERLRVPASAPPR